MGKPGECKVISGIFQEGVWGRGRRNQASGVDQRKRGFQHGVSG